MNPPKERILVVENDLSIGDLVARQTLMPLGFRVQVVTSAASAIQEAVRFAPDVVIANMSLPGLSGKDLLAAFSAQGLEMPVIVIAEKGMESDVIQSFRLGASDFLGLPLREAEIVSAVERVLRQVRSRREREVLSRQLNQTNQELQRRVRELTTIFAMGKAVISITDVRALMEKIVEGAVYVAEADAGWLLLRDDRSKNFILSAHRNLPKSLSANMNQPWDDGLSSLVALSGEALAIHGEPLKRFKVAAMGQAALVVPVKVRNDVVGLLTVVRKAPQPIGASSQALLEAVADYASIAIVNARLFRALEDRALTSQAAADTARLGEKITCELLHQSSIEIKNDLSAMQAKVELLLGDTMGKSNNEQITALNVVKERIKSITEIANTMLTVLPDEASRKNESVETDLNALARQSVGRFQPLAQQQGIMIFSELSTKPVIAIGQSLPISKVIDGFLSNAIRFSPQGGQIMLRVERTADGKAHLSVQDKGPGIEGKAQATIFDRSYQSSGTTGNRRYAGLAISLPLIKDIIAALNGRIWVDSKPGAGSIFHFSLPAK